MIDKEEIQIMSKKVLEMIYWLYQKDLKSGDITKDKLVPSFGKILKKKSLLNKNDEPTLFNYDK